jgi:hypothetical protein
VHLAVRLGPFQAEQVEQPGQHISLGGRDAAVGRGQGHEQLAGAPPLALRQEASALPVSDHEIEQ